MHASGCPHNCCANLIAEIGLSGKLTREGDETKQAYDILLGGVFGPEPQFGRHVEQKVPASEAKHKIASLLSNYMKRRTYSEKMNSATDIQSRK